MPLNYKLKSGQINFENQDARGSYACIVIKDGVIHNMREDQRLDLIRILESYAPKAQDAKPTVDLEDMF